jgi:hypothetical protein
VRGALVAAAVLLALHLFARDVAEGAKLSALAVLAAPAAVVRDAASERRPILDARRATEARAASRAGLFSARGLAALPVLDHRPEAGYIVVGAGRESNVVFGAAVTSPEGLLGHVDRVETHLSRVRLLAANGARAAVAYAGAKRNLPGGITTLAAVVEGRGETGALVDGALLEAFRPGDRLTVFGKPEIPVGVVTRAGPEPGVVFAARADAAGAVAVEGVALAFSPPELFQSERLRAVAEPVYEGRGAVLVGREAARASPGAAVFSGGVYLGRVTRTSGDVAFASRSVDRGHRVGVRAVADGAEIGISLVSEGGGLYRVEGTPPVSQNGTFDAFTAGGGGLVPPDLYVGRLRAEGALWRADDAFDRWPKEVEVAVFLFEEERARLRSGR